MLRELTVKTNSERILEADNISKETWSIINGHRSTRTKGSEPIHLKKGSDTVTSQAAVAEDLNDYYIKLPQSIMNNPTPNMNLYSPANCNTIFLEPVSPPEILKFISQLKNKKSCGLDDISNSLIKDIANEIIVPLSHTINLSFSSGKFPDILKESKVIPLYKKGDKTLPENYRPLTLTSNVAKIYEKAYNDRLVNFLLKNEIIVKEQFGFQKNKSTIDAVSLAMETIIQSMNKKEKVAGLFLDMSKAFDCVDHTKLLKILEHYGIRGNALDWIRTYLINRKQCVELKSTLNQVIDSIKSQSKIVKYGVPQGSILGPILFLIYINELKYYISKITDCCCIPVLYADDANLIISGETLQSITAKAGLLALKIIAFLNDLNLVVNISKTNYMLFSLHQIETSLDIQVNDHDLQQTHFTKFLGIFLDDRLTWSTHIEETAKKIRTGIFILKQLAQSVNIYIKHILHSSIVTYAMAHFCGELLQKVKNLSSSAYKKLLLEL